MGMRETTLAPGQLFRSVHMEKSYLGKADYPVLYKVDPRVGELPQGNELSWDHVDSPKSVSFDLLIAFQREITFFMVNVFLRLIFQIQAHESSRYDNLGLVEKPEA